MVCLAHPSLEHTDITTIPKSARPAVLILQNVDPMVIALIITALRPAVQIIDHAHVFDRLRVALFDRVC